MRSLFIKIFLWFGLAMVVVNVASFVTGVLIARRAQRSSVSPMAPLFSVCAQTAIEIFDKDGRSALTSYLDRLEGTAHIRAFLTDDHGNDVSGRPLPNGAKELAERLAKTSGFLIDFSYEHPQPLCGQSVHARNGALYVLVAELPRPDFPGPPGFGNRGSFLFGVRLAAQIFLPLLLIGALFCYWLARHLSTPIVQLRGATQELSDGIFTARVDQRLLRRHDEIGYLSRDFNLMASRIESLIEAQRRLLGDISHEMRSPLARHGVALGLARRRASPEVMPALDRIAREAGRMNEMIDQLLTLSRIESGADGVDKIEIDLAALVREIADDADFEARARECSVCLVELEQVTMTGVPELLRSAIENVVRNAVRHTEVETQVEVWLSSENTGFALISVRDHGKGVPEAALDHIFRPFYRVEHARDRKTGGTGLGLSIAAYSVQLHKGTIKALNAPGGGLTVEIRLPFRKPIADESA